MTAKLTAPGKLSTLARLELNGWQHLDAQDAIRRTFTFPDFSGAMAWMNSVASLAEEMNHHPEWCNVYNRVTVTLTTHSANSLTQLDIQLADGMDRLYKDCNGPP